MRRVRVPHWLKKARRPDLSPNNSKIFVRQPIGLPHPRRTTSVKSHNHGICPIPPINTALSPSPRTAPPATTNPASTPAHHRPPPCLHTRERPIRRIPAAQSSTATKDHTNNTTARQIPPPLPQRTQAEPQSRKPRLRPASIRRRQEAHGHEKVPKHDESRRNVFTLVSA